MNKAFHFLTLSLILSVGFSSFAKENLKILKAQIDLINCEERVFKEKEYIEEVNEGLSSCIQDVFDYQESFCLLDTQYQYDHKFKDSYFYNNRIHKLYFKKSFYQCMDGALEEDLDVNFKYDQLRSLALCMGAEPFNPLLDEELALNLSACMSHNSQSQKFLEEKYQQLKKYLAVKQIKMLWKKGKEAIDEFCTEPGSNGSSYSWCKGAFEVFRQWWQNDVMPEPEDESRSQNSLEEQLIKNLCMNIQEAAKKEKCEKKAKELAESSSGVNFY